MPNPEPIGAAKGITAAAPVAANPATFVSMGNLRDPNTALALCGLVTIAALRARQVRASILLCMLLTTAAGAIAGLVHWQPQSYAWPDMFSTMLKLDIGAAWRIGLLEIVFVFLFVDLFDNLGTLVAVSQKAGLVDSQGQIPRLNRILIVDASATITGSLAGTTTVVSFIESAAGVAAGGRSGVVAVVTGLLFVLELFIAISSAATAPALVVVGALMISAVAGIDWNNAAVGVPAFLTLITIPLTFSIANGLAFGIVAHVLLKVASGQGRRVPIAAYALAALLLVRFVYLGSRV